jgi:RNA polymerase sigma-70 factor, ECF subfamily
MGADAPSVTQWLNRLREGDEAAAKAVVDALYTELHRLARRYMMRERSDHTLQPTALVNEAYMHLIEQRDRSWQNRSHFMASAAQVMRRILIDHARARVAEKRGGGMAFVALDGDVGVPTQTPEDLLAIDQALARLTELDPELGKLVELRFFAGLTEDEVAEVMGLNVRTVKRRWSSAKAWLLGELRSKSDNRSS